MMIYRDEDPALLRRQLDLTARRVERYRNLYLRWRKSWLLSLLRGLVLSCGVFGVMFSFVVYTTNSDLVRLAKHREDDFKTCQTMKSTAYNQLMLCRGDVLLCEQSQRACERAWSRCANQNQ